MNALAQYGSSVQKAIIYSASYPSLVVSFCRKYVLHIGNSFSSEVLIISLLEKMHLGFSAFCAALTSTFKGSDHDE
ncbi:MAG: hypothetical protein HC848_00170 [Limnobacter sp.]|nr:hypothetical protein [Limnobacter sp.]